MLSTVRTHERALRSGFIPPIYAPCKNDGHTADLTDWQPSHPALLSGQIYACTDVQNNLAELRFVCDPDGDGDAQCFGEAGTANVQALEIHVSTGCVPPPPTRAVALFG